jgi:dienelactone hydrolase
MIGKAIDIRTPDGTMDGYAACPDGGGRFPLVVLFMDVWGLREELFATARRVTSHGYYCVVPNLFYRDGKVRHERRNASGKTVSFDTLPEALQAEIRGHADKLNRQTARTDIAAILDFCRAEPVADGPAGSFGFCLGGRLAFHAGQEFPQRFFRQCQPARNEARLRQGGFAPSPCPCHARRNVLRFRRERSLRPAGNDRRDCAGFRAVHRRLISV